MNEPKNFDFILKMLLSFHKSCIAFPEKSGAEIGSVQSLFIFVPIAPQTKSKWNDGNEGHSGKSFIQPEAIRRKEN